MTDKTLGLLGLMRRASAIVPGEDDASEAVISGKARILLIPRGVSAKKRERAERYLEGRSCELVELPFTEDELSKAVGTGGCSMAAVTDLGFAVSLCRQLAEADSGKYGEPYARLLSRSEKQRRRKTEKPGVRAVKK